MLLILLIIIIVLIKRSKKHSFPEKPQENILESRKPTYAEKLQDPRWMAKRKSILERDNYTCQYCGAKDHLQVHHYYYIRGREPWEYGDKALVTLCNKCHYKWHKTHKYKIYG